MICFETRFQWVLQWCFWECKRYQWCPGRIQSCRMLSILWSHGCINRLYGFCDSVLLQRFWAEQYCCTALSCWRLLSRAEKICKAFKSENLFFGFSQRKAYAILPTQHFPRCGYSFCRVVWLGKCSNHNFNTFVCNLQYLQKNNKWLSKPANFLQWRR